MGNLTRGFVVDGLCKASVVGADICESLSWDNGGYGSLRKLAEDIARVRRRR